MIISRTPLRICFVGGGTDLKDFYENYGTGEVINASINRYVYVLVRESFDSKTHINCAYPETVVILKDIKHDLIRETIKYVGITDPLDITIASDVPATGSGLGSSASLIVGLLNALYYYQDRPKSKEVLAEQACEIEIDILKKPVGKQDQYIAAHGGLRHIQFFPDGSVAHEDLDLIYHGRYWNLSESLMLFDTGIERKVEDVMTELKARISETSEILIQLKSYVSDLKRALTCKEVFDLEWIGTLLRYVGALKKLLAKNVVNDEIANIYEKAKSAGAIGGKITGAGGGGYILLFVPTNYQDAVREALQLPELKFSFESEGTRIIAHTK